MRRWRWLAMLSLLCILTGCWDARELNHLALVMAVGIDKAEGGRFRVTIQVARPGGSRAGGGGAESTSKEPVFTASADGDTIFAAIRNLAQFTSRRIMWAHNAVVVIGESLAREDITPVIDFFTRSPELRMRTWLVVARGTDARTVVAAKTGLEEVPAVSISAIMRYAALPGEAVRTDVAAVARSFTSPDLNTVISAVAMEPHVVPNPGGAQQDKAQGLQVTLRGTAIFRGPRLVGFVDKDVGRGLLWLRGEMRNAVITVPCPKGKPGAMAVELRSPKTHVRPQFRGSTPAVRLVVETKGWLSEQDCRTFGLDPLELAEAAEAAMAEKIRSSITEALRYLQQEVRVDAADFGEHFHREYPAWWRANRQRWEEIFPQIPVEVELHAEVTRLGLYARPLIPQFPGRSDGGKEQ